VRETKEGIEGGCDGIGGRGGGGGGGSGGGLRGGWYRLTTSSSSGSSGSSGGGGGGGGGCGMRVALVWGICNRKKCEMPVMIGPSLHPSEYL